MSVSTEECVAVVFDHFDASYSPCVLSATLKPQIEGEQ